MGVQVPAKLIGRQTRDCFFALVRFSRVDVLVPDTFIIESNFNP